MARYNKDIISSVEQLETIINSLDKNVVNCKDTTKAQVTAMQAKIAQGSHTDESIIANLSTGEKHIEYMMAKMKMQHTVHDYIEYGVSFGDIYLTLVPQ